jgi:hypothetical protein
MRTVIQCSDQYQNVTDPEHWIKECLFELVHMYESVPICPACC